MIEAKVIGAESVQSQMVAISRRGQDRVRTAVRRQGLELLRLVKQKLSDDVLHVRSGRLRRSINEQDQDDGTTFQASVGTNVVYGRAWELGFTRPARILQATKAKAIFWPGAAHPVRSVSQPAKTFAPRSFLASSLQARKVEIRIALLDAIKGAADGR